MQGAEQPSRAPLALFAFDSPEAIKDYALGCDADVGGTSTVHLDFDEDSNPAPAPAPAPSPAAPVPGRKRGAARFYGHMRLAVRPGHEQRIRGGYAGFRNKVSVDWPPPPPPTFSCG
jgi:NADH dehydrogenase [ubiquinone] 1 alpha subcomplex assembly factor 1